MSAGLDVIILADCIAIEGNVMDNLCSFCINEWDLTNHHARDLRVTVVFHVSCTIFKMSAL
jgi:hypothetical protein